MTLYEPSSSSLFSLHSLLSCKFSLLAMVLFPKRLALSLRLSPSLKIHPHNLPKEALSASVRSFWSDVSAELKHLSLTQKKPGSKNASLQWIRQCLQILLIINRGVAKVLVDANCPLNEWEVASVEEYLSYSLGMLHLLNVISSYLSQLGQFRLSLAHALSLLESSPSSTIQRLKTIELRSPKKDFMENVERWHEEKHFACKRGTIHEALLVMGSTCFSVCGTVLSVLSGDPKPFLEMKNLANLPGNTSMVAGIDLNFSNNEIVGLEEVDEITSAVACLSATIGAGKNVAEQLHSRLEVLQKHLEGVGVGVGHLFSEVLAGRNELLQSLGQKIQ